MITKHNVKLAIENNEEKSSRIAMPKFKQKKSFLRIAVCVCGFILAAFCVAKFISIPDSSTTEIIMLDIGQGDSIVVKSEDKTYMIDTGNKVDLITARMQEQGITHLDGLFVSHPDDDHCGCVDTVASKATVDAFYCAKDMTTCSCKNCTKLISKVDSCIGSDHIKTLEVGDTINFGEVSMEVI